MSHVRAASCGGTTRRENKDGAEHKQRNYRYLWLLDSMCTLFWNTVTVLCLCVWIRWTRAAGPARESRLSALPFSLAQDTGCSGSAATEHLPGQECHHLSNVSLNLLISSLTLFFCVYRVFIYMVIFSATVLFSDSCVHQKSIVYIKSLHSRPQMKKTNHMSCNWIHPSGTVVDALISLFPFQASFSSSDSSCTE